MKRALGKRGEDLAAKFLEKKGYQILERNYRGERGEIDIVAQAGQTLVFVEVKTKKYGDFGEPETWVNQRKQQQIGKVASKYLQEKEIDGVDCRFDVVALTFENGHCTVKHIENAFWL